MRSLLISGIYRPEIGGPATYLPALANKILLQGDQVTVVTLKDSNARAVKEPWAISYITRDQNLLLRFIKTFLSILRKTKASDSIFANGLFQETAMALVLSKRKSVAKVVGDPVWERARNQGKTKLNIIEFNDSALSVNHKFQRLFIRWSLNQFTIITCPSLELKSLLQGWGIKRPIEFIPNGVAPVIETAESKEFDLVCVCRLVTWKNLDKLVKVCAITQSRLVIVGSGPEETKLKTLAHELKADVNFTGQLDENGVLETLQKSKVFILLSDYEGLSFSLLQAMACGLPSIVSNTKGNTAVITNDSDGVIVDIQNDEKLAQAIKDLLESPERLKNYGAEARKKVMLKYHQDNQIQKVIDLLETQGKK